MKHLGWIRGVSKASGIVFSILKVLSLIGAIGLVLCVLGLSFLPADLFRVKIHQSVLIGLNYADYLGEEEWNAYKESLDLEEEENLTLTDEGMEMEMDLSALTFTNRSIALLLLPTFVQLCVSFPLYRFLQGACRELTESPSPFSRKAALSLRRAGITLWVLAGAPTVCSTLVGIMTGGAMAPATEGIDLMTVLGGFLLFALSHLLEYGADLLESPTPTNHDSSFENPNAF